MLKIMEKKKTKKYNNNIFTLLVDVSMTTVNM